MTNPLNNEWDAALAAFQGLSDMLKGLVSTLIAEGWSEEHAREIVVAAFIKNMRGDQ